MKKHGTVIVVLMGILAVLLAGASHKVFSDQASPADVQQYVKTYEYDHAAPLNATETQTGVYPVYTAYHIAFDSTNGERVPGVLYLPKNGAARNPCVIVQHGYGGDKSMGGMFAGTLAPQGFAVIAIDAEYHGERKEPGKDVLATDVENDERAWHQSIQDLSRVVDYLETRTDIDMQRIGYVGASMGAFFGAVFTGVDKRVKTAVLVVGGGDWDVFINNSMVPPAVVIRDYYKKAGMPLSDFAQGMAPVDPVHFISLFAPHPLLMINCSNDTIVPRKTGELLFEAAGEPKYIEWLKCDAPIGHIPPIGKTQQLVMKWFKKQL